MAYWQLNTLGIACLEILDKLLNLTLNNFYNITHIYALLFVFKGFSLRLVNILSGKDNTFDDNTL